MNKVCVIGLGRFGMVLAERLGADGLDVLAIDRSQEVVENVKDRVALAVRADATDIEVLRSLGVDGMDLVAIAIGDDFESSELTLMACRELGARLIYARANDQVKYRILKALGAHKVIMPEEDAALRLAKNLASPALVESLELDREHSMVQLVVPRKVVGKTPRELVLREKYNLNLVAIKGRKSATVIVPADGGCPSGQELDEALLTIPTGDTVIHAGDVLIIVGKDENIDRFVRANE